MLFKECFEKIGLKEYYKQFLVDYKRLTKKRLYLIKRVLNGHINKNMTQHWLLSKKYTKGQKYQRILSGVFTKKKITRTIDRSRKYVLDVSRPPNPAYRFHRLGAGKCYVSSGDEFDDDNVFDSDDEY